MHEYAINPSLLGPQYSHKALDFVLCRIKKNESEQHIEKANLGKKPRNSKQVSETEKDSERRASGCKRKLKVAATSNSNIYHDDECFENKQLTAKQESVLVKQCHSSCSSNSLKPVKPE